MAKAKVDAYRVLLQLRAGIDATTVAKLHGVSRQAIDLWRKRFVKQGLLAKAKRGRPRVDMEVDYIRRRIDEMDEYEQLLKKTLKALIAKDKKEDEDRTSELRTPLYEKPKKVSYE